MKARSKRRLAALTALAAATLSALLATAAAASPACDVAREKYDELRARSTMNEAQYANSVEAADVLAHCRGLPPPQAGGSVRAPLWYGEKPRRATAATNFRSGDPRVETRHRGGQHRHARPPALRKHADGESPPPASRARLPAR